MRRKPTGTLVNDALLPGKRLWMFATGTGIAPFASVIRDPETYEKFDDLILCHTCRDPLVGELAQRLTLYDTLTRAPWPREGRQTDLMASGKMFRDLDVPPISPDRDRAMICGSMAMLNDTKAALESFGLVDDMRIDLTRRHSTHFYSYTNKFYARSKR